MQRFGPFFSSHCENDHPSPITATLVGLVCCWWARPLDQILMDQRVAPAAELSHRESSSLDQMSFANPDSLADLRGPTEQSRIYAASPRT